MDASTHTAGRAGTRSKTDPAGHPATHSLAEEALFEDRSEAGRLLAAAVAHLAPSRPVVLALPRGGVPVAVPVARALHAPLGLVLVHKIGAPG
jgi:adenine/guanine phosphoribosyltransferase-like PRPP-binding protein